LSRQTLESDRHQYGDGLLVVDRDGAALLSNPALRRMLGLKENEDVPKTVRTMRFFRADKVRRIAPAESPTSRAVAGGHVDDEEIFIRHGSNVEGSWADVTRGRCVTSRARFWRGGRLS